MSRITRSLLITPLLMATLVFAYAATPTDLRLAEQIRSNIIVDERVSSEAVSIDVDSRSAMLRGEVGHLPAKRAAGLIAASTPGVRDVKNLISVRPDGRADSEIRNDVVDALSEDASADFYQIHVDVENGVIELTGKVDSYTEKKMAEEAAAAVRGVTAIRNGIVVDVPRWRSDYEVEKDVERRIHTDPRLRRFPIRVDVDQGVVHLSGAVNTAAQKYWARALGWAAGAREVRDSRIYIRGDTESEKPIEVAQRTPVSNRVASAPAGADLRRAVLDALALQPSLAKELPSVRVSNGEVTLTGTVQTLALRRLAAEIARDVPGVRKISNNLALETRVEVANEILSNRVQRAIDRDPYLADDMIRVRVDRGEAMLVGVVDSEFERQHLDRVVGRVFGISSIKNAARAAAFEE